MGCVSFFSNDLRFTCSILPSKMIDAELEKNLYILFSLFLFFLEREIIVDMMFLFMGLCF